MAVSGEPKNWRRYDALYKKYADTYGVPWTWLKAIALNESDNGNYPSVARGVLNPTDVKGSTSQDGKSWGIMQMVVPTARDMDSTLRNLSDNEVAIRLNNPEYSIKLGAKYVAKLSTLFPRLDLRYVEWTIKSYNQGPGNTRKEISGAIKAGGYASEYWTRFQRNLKKVESMP